MRPSTLPQTALSLLATQDGIKQAQSPLLFMPISSLLSSGLPRGQITTIAGGPKSGKSLLAHHAIVSFLLDPANGFDLVAVIDPGEVKGEFSIDAPSKLLEQRLRERSYMDGSNMQALIANYLDRVLVMRAFDYQGMMAVLSEVAQRLQASIHAAQSKESASVQQGASPPRPARKRRRIVQDSDPENSASSLSPSPSPDSPRAPRSPLTQPPPAARSSRISLLIVEELSQAIHPRMSAAPHHLTAQSHLATLMRTLSSLTTSYSLVTLILNSVVNSAQSVRREADPEVAPSIFEAETCRPALGRGLGHFVDVSLMLGRVAKRRGNVVEGLREKRREEMGVIEVLQDRYGHTRKRWAAFEISGLDFVESKI